jgi:hypothetical protein
MAKLGIKSALLFRSKPLLEELSFTSGSGIHIRFPGFSLTPIRLSARATLVGAWPSRCPTAATDSPDSYSSLA